MKYPVFDAHCDTAFELCSKHALLGSNDCHISLERMERQPGSAQFFAFWTVDPDCSDPSCESAQRLFLRMYDELMRQLVLFADRIALCRCAADAQSAAQEGRTAAFLSIEGAEGIGCDPAQLERAWNMGFRMTTLTWNAKNSLAGSHCTGGGLTDRGREFVKEAQRLGMLIDVSHLSDQAFWDLADITNGPIVASHSNSRSVYPHSRNLTDDQFREIVQTGGFVGLNLYTSFLGDGIVTPDHAAKHLLHWIALGGEDYIGMGGDLDGCDSLPFGMTGIDDYSLLVSALVKHGFSEQTVQNILYNNLMKVVRQCSI